MNKLTRGAISAAASTFAALLPQFVSAVGLGTASPDLVARFGRGPTIPTSLRPPVKTVLL